MMRAASNRPLAVVAIEIISLVGVLALQAGLAVRLLLDASLKQHPALMAGLAVAGYLSADVVTGFVHWFADTFFEEETPLIGPWLIAPFREHHRDPQAMTRHGFLELAGNSCFVLAPILAVALWLGQTMEPVAASALCVFILSFSWFAAATNVFHRWAHEAQPPRAVVWLQRCGVILPPAHHRLHHQSPHNTSFCVTSGWANRWLDRIRFFPRAERVLIALGLPRTSS